MNGWGRNWWAEVQGRWQARRRPSRPRPGARSYGLEFDSLEDRCLLSGAGLYQQLNLVSDQPGQAQVLDPSLVNAWGIALPPTGGAFWVSDNHTGRTTLYSGAVNGGPLIDNALPIAVPGGALTGQVFNGTDDFIIHSGNDNGPALFIFASASGQISGWNPAVPAPGFSMQAETAFTATDGAMFTGITLAGNGTANFLYAADFHNGTIDIFDHHFQPTRLSGSFTDPTLPAGFAPFNIQYLGDRLYVTYAKQDAAKQDSLPGAGDGFVDVFDTNGNLVMRLGSGGPLNTPWGLALAPADFGVFSNDLLVGNFGSGRISAFDPQRGGFLGQLNDVDGNPLTIDGLWGLSFGNGVTAGDTNVLFFAAGPDNETHGLFGSLQPADRQLGPAGVSSLRTAAQKVYVPGASGAAEDEYPLPPVGGPGFRQDGTPQPGQLPVLLPANGLPLALLPGSVVAAGETDQPPAPDARSARDPRAESARNIVALLGSDMPLAVLPAWLHAANGPAGPRGPSDSQTAGPESAALSISARHGPVSPPRLPAGNAAPLEQPYTVDILLGLATHRDFVDDAEDTCADSIPGLRIVRKQFDSASVQEANLDLDTLASWNSNGDPTEISQAMLSVPGGVVRGAKATPGVERVHQLHREQVWFGKLLLHFVVGILVSGVPLIWAYTRAGSTRSRKQA